MRLSLVAVAGGIALVQLAVSLPYTAWVRSCLETLNPLRLSHAQIPFMQPVKHQNDTWYNVAKDSDDFHTTGMFDTTGNAKAEDRQKFLHAYDDMMNVLGYVANNPNPQLITRYFGATPPATVTAIFQVVNRLGGVGYRGTLPGTIRPLDLNQIELLRLPGNNDPTLAESFSTEFIGGAQRIAVYEFGWAALYKLTRDEITCADIGTKTNFKMHFLGTLILHEVLHFNVVPNLAWTPLGAGNPNPPHFLQPKECTDDQDGTYPFTYKAYGPWEATELVRQNDPTKPALLNIENYIWYALESYWLHECPNNVPAGHLFDAATDNDVPNLCKQAAKGALQKIWCWRS